MNVEIALVAAGILQMLVMHNSLVQFLWHAQPIIASLLQPAARVLRFCSHASVNPNACASCPALASVTLVYHNCDMHGLIRLPRALSRRPSKSRVESWDVNSCV